MFDKNAKHPDALIIYDDNIVDFAMAGILDAGVDVEIIAHANFPWVDCSGVPHTRLGYDMHELLRIFLSQLKSLNQNKKPRAKLLKACFESELTDK